MPHALDSGAMYQYIIQKSNYPLFIDPSIEVRLNLKTSYITRTFLISADFTSQVLSNHQ